MSTHKYLEVSSPWQSALSGFYVKDADFTGTGEARRKIKPLLPLQ
jgi:hypothetical protein